jgi:hypothetical protein
MRISERGARLARREERAYREYSSDEQRGRPRFRPPAREDAIDVRRVQIVLRQHPANVAPRATRPGTISLSAASTMSATIGAAAGAARLHAATPAHAARTIANVIRRSVTAAASNTCRVQPVSIARRRARCAFPAILTRDGASERPTFPPLPIIEGSWLPSSLSAHFVRRPNEQRPSLRSRTMS